MVWPAVVEQRTDVTRGNKTDLLHDVECSVSVAKRLKTAFDSPVFAEWRIQCAFPGPRTYPAGLTAAL